MSSKKPNIAEGMRVKLRDSEYPGHGTVTKMHPPDDRPAYRGQTWFEVRWDDFGGDEGTEADHRDTDLAPVVEPCVVERDHACPECGVEWYRDSAYCTSDHGVEPEQPTCSCGKPERGRGPWHSWGRCALYAGALDLPVVEPTKPIDTSGRGLVKHLTGLDDETIDRLGWLEDTTTNSIGQKHVSIIVRGWRPKTGGDDA